MTFESEFDQDRQDRFARTMVELQTGWEVVHDFRDNHRFRGRQIAYVGSNGKPTDSGYVWSLSIYLHDGTPIPPKFAPVIDALLADAGLEQLPVIYQHSGHSRQ